MAVEQKCKNCKWCGFIRAHYEGNTIRSKINVEAVCGYHHILMDWTLSKSDCDNWEQWAP